MKPRLGGGFPGRARFGALLARELIEKRVAKTAGLGVRMPLYRGYRIGRSAPAGG